MKKVLTVLFLGLALAISSVALAGEGCEQAAKGTCPMAQQGGCSGGQGCIWTDGKVDFALAEDGDALKLAAVVNGCAGKRAAFQKKLTDELAQDAAGKGCSGCPFSVQGLTFTAENTDLGATVKVSGPADKRAEFKTRYEAKMAARKAPAAEGGCGCGGHGAAAFGQ
jgi:hypothetical protein